MVCGVVVGLASLVELSLFNDHPPFLERAPGAQG